MPSFPCVEQLALPCCFVRFVPGKPHANGKRYLPLIVFEAPRHVGAAAGPAILLGIVDRHHVVDTALEGRIGIAQLVFLLSTVQLQSNPVRHGLEDESGATGGAILAPTIYGRVVAAPTWEMHQEHLPYQELFAELLLDIGIGVVGVRTHLTADSLAEKLGKPQIEPGDWLRVSRSRIDILGFKPLV